MKFLIVLFFVLLFVAFGWAVGYMTGKSKNTLNGQERRELDVLRALRNDLTVAASEHATLGDAFGVIVLSKISDTYTALRKGNV